MDSVANKGRGKGQGCISSQVLAGAAAGLRAEAADEMALVEEAQLLRQAGHRQLHDGQQLAGTLDTAAAHVAQWARAGSGAEQPHQMEAAHAGRVSQLSDPHRL